MSTAAINTQPSAVSRQPVPGMPPPTPAELREDVIEALVEDGFKRADSRDAVAASGCSSMEFSELYRESLRQLRPLSRPVPKPARESSRPGLGVEEAQAERKCSVAACEIPGGRRLRRDNRSGICTPCQHRMAAAQMIAGGQITREAIAQRARIADSPESQVPSPEEQQEQRSPAPPQSAAELPEICAPLPASAGSPKPEAAAPSSGLGARGSGLTCAGYKKACDRPLGAKNTTGLCPLCSARRRYAEGQGTAPERQCACGTKLRRDNRSGICIQCQDKMGRREFREAARPGVSRNPALRDLPQNPVKSREIPHNAIPQPDAGGRMPVLLSEPQIARFLERMPDWKDFVRRLPAALKLALVNHYFAVADEEAAAA
jgi:hypothetical protein